MFHPDGGVIDPERAMAAMRAIAAAHGAQIYYGSPVLRVEAVADGATVHTADQSWRAPTVVVAAVGAFHFASRTPQPWPAFIWYGDMVRYGLPAGRDGEVPGAIKVGE